ncbi:zinc dependent phospholipase C family protein [Bacillus sp. H-16]|uniref:zinc dependent phospholipase C family protein n=1 Tax=Alteribacter salitolerans TaxID=2912333 RepID=UPI001965D953|nr:zinc dependent phospholipase C family protein [Alteribacter salitolerans]MBM7097586.1 zinc dependent phospholipase C family protein [Alteribacter salitolerans]
MGSRIMHLVIADKIAERMGIEDKTLFLLGGIAPDAASSKDLSHFYRGSLEDYSRNIDYNGFLQKYHSLAERDYIWGYFTHLIADDLWLKGFYLPWLKNRMEADKEIFRLYHEDFRVLNGKILDYFGYTEQLKEQLRYTSDIIDLQEVKSKEVKEFIPYLTGDMDYDQKVIDQRLTVFTLSQIIGYIETSVDKGMVNIREVLN